MPSIEELNVIAYGQPPRGAAIVGSMFVYQIKMNPDGTIEKLKVRLVALGNHQKYGEPSLRPMHLGHSSRHHV
jgi:hypothetical protein